MKRLILSSLRPMPNASYQWTSAVRRVPSSSRILATPCACATGQRRRPCATGRAHGSCRPRQSSPARGSVRRVGSPHRTRIPAPDPSSGPPFSAPHGLSRPDRGRFLAPMLAGVTGATPGRRCRVGAVGFSGEVDTCCLRPRGDCRRGSDELGLQGRERGERCRPRPRFQLPGKPGCPLSHREGLGLLLPALGVSRGGRLLRRMLHTDHRLERQQGLLLLRVLRRRLRRLRRQSLQQRSSHVW